VKADFLEEAFLVLNSPHRCAQASQIMLLKETGNDTVLEIRVMKYRYLVFGTAE